MSRTESDRRCNHCDNTDCQVESTKNGRENESERRESTVHFGPYANTCITLKAIERRRQLICGPLWLESLYRSLPFSFCLLTFGE